MKESLKPKCRSRELSLEEEQLLAIIHTTYQDVEILQNVREHLNGKMQGDDDSKLQMYLTIARNCLVESQSLLATNRQPQAQKRLELAMNELRSAKQIAQCYSQEVQHP
jgi:hypothetical protein